MALSQKWKDTVDKGINDKRWDDYDADIKREVTGYGAKFAKKSQFLEKPLPTVNWLYIKAMLWVESGGPDNPAWKTRPMQIGNSGDPGFDVLKQGKEGSRLIMSQGLQKDLEAGLINKPKVNVCAGIAYLYTRMAKSQIKTLYDDQDKKVYEYTVISGDNLTRIAGKVGTTVEELKDRNKSAGTMIKPGRKLKYRKAKKQRAIIDWRPFTTQNIAERYNGGGDPDYAAKLNYLIKNVFPKLQRGKVK